MKNKKAALELSVNAIVILIIAIVMLALGLGFVRTLFGGATEKIGDLIDQEIDPVQPTSNNPLEFSRDRIQLAPGKSAVFKYSYYNTNTTDQINLHTSINCNGITSTTGVDIQPPAQKVVQAGDIVTSIVLVKAEKSVDQDTYLCQLELYSMFSTTPPTNQSLTARDFIIEVE